MPAFLLILFPFLISGISSLFLWFVKTAAKRIILFGLMIAALVSVTVAFWIAIDTSLSGLSLLMPAIIKDGASLVTPDNLPFCMSLIVSSHIAKLAYDWNAGLIQTKFTGS